MANLTLTHLVLDDRWPGQANPNYGIPTDGWDNTTENFNTADDTEKSLSPPIPIGQKRQVYTDNTNAPGTYTMIYLAYHDYSAVDISGDYSDGPPFCGHADTTHATPLGADLSTPPYYVVARCYTAAAWDATKGMPVALPCSTSIEADSSVNFSSGDPATNGYGHGWGWFWCGGVCPAKDVTLFRGSGDSLAGADITAVIEHPGAFKIDIDTARAVVDEADTSSMLDATGITGPLVVHGICDMSAE
jgi:hypothetical protein